MTGETRLVVLGLGNLLYSDEGVGIQALAPLRAALGAQQAVEILDGGTLGLDLLPLVEACSHLLILDTINAGSAPGTLVELRDKEIPLYSGIKLSEHQVSFQEVLGLASMRGSLPQHLHLIGVQPALLAMGVELSPTVAAVVPVMVQRALLVLEEWGLVPPARSA